MLTDKGMTQMVSKEKDGGIGSVVDAGARTYVWKTPVGRGPPRGPACLGVDQ